jgi:hypothetical protein
MGSERQSFCGRERAVAFDASGRIDTGLFTRQPMDNGSVRNRLRVVIEKNRAAVPRGSHMASRT